MYYCRDNYAKCFFVCVSVAILNSKVSTRESEASATSSKFFSGEQTWLRWAVPWADIRRGLITPTSTTAWSQLPEPRTGRFTIFCPQRTMASCRRTFWRSMRQVEWEMGMKMSVKFAILPFLQFFFAFFAFFPHGDWVNASDGANFVHCHWNVRRAYLSIHTDHI